MFMNNSTQALFGLGFTFAMETVGTMAPYGKRALPKTLPYSFHFIDL